MKYSLCFWLIFSALGASAQVSEQFTDSNFTQNPTWTGDDTLWTVNAKKQLQTLNTGKAATATLRTPSTMALNTTWELYLQTNLASNASTSNQTRVYLISDVANIKGSLKGYYIGIGETGANDSYDLFMQNGTKSTKIIDGIAKRASYDSLRAMIKVNRSSTGLWSVFTDTTGKGTKYVLEGFTQENTFTTSAFFGVYAKHSATKSDKFIFDNISIRRFEVDTFPPNISNVNVYDTLHLGVKFNEAIKSTSVSNAANFNINNGIGAAISAVFVNPDSVYLTFANAINTNSYELTVKKVADTSGNINTADTITFSYKKPFLASAGAVVINEIYADPSPQVELPSTEFVELYNTTNENIGLNGWKYSDGTSTKTFGLKDSILAKQYLIICTIGDTASYTPFGKTLGISPFPSLNNTSDRIFLRSQNNTLIDSVNYTDGWYEDDLKKAGGYTLERKRFQSKCNEIDNWTASNDTTGGTPGVQNTVFNNGTTGIRVTSFPNPVLGSFTLRFSDKVDSTEMVNLQNYKFLDLSGREVIITKNISRLNGNEIKFFITKNTVAGIYFLIIKNIKNCEGDSINSSLKIVILEDSEEAGVVINEIFADPSPVLGLPEKEFIEIYNSGADTVSIGDWTITDGSTKGTFPAGSKILPKEYKILCKSTDTAEFKPFGNVIALETIPSLNNSGDNISLMNADGDLKDNVNYTDAWYRSNLKKEGGYALERINPYSPCNTANNWIASADTLVGGTPGKENSVINLFTDTAMLRIITAVFVTSNTLKITFNRAIDSTATAVVANFNLNNGGGKPQVIQTISNDAQSLNLVFGQVLTTGISYTLNYKATACAGDTASSSISNIILPQKAEINDLIINEVLFNPYPNEFDFVEIFNNSNKIIDLSTISLANTNATGGIASAKKLSLNQILIQPKQYYVITASKASVTAKYFCKSSENIIQLASMPSYNDDEGTVILALDSTVLDKFNYKDDIHFSQLEDEEGVSLERVDANIATQANANFHSASASVGYATPTYTNSQSNELNTKMEAVYLEAKRFSPDNDGFEDYANILYNLDAQGYTISITVYDAAGTSIKKILRNELIGLNGKYTWDGTNDDNITQAVGVYVVFAQTISPSGEIKTYKLPTVLAKMF